MIFRGKMQRVLLISLLCSYSYNFVECYHLCSETNTSCSYQLWSNKTEDACQMVHYPKNSLECKDELPEKPKRNVPEKGAIQIMPFVAESESRTVFKVTASDISWTNLKIRFKQQNTQQKCIKREFIIKEAVPKNKSLIYDCPWSTSAYEDKNLDFEYSFGETKRTFVVHVPKSELIKNYYTNQISALMLFTYVETTSLYQLVYKIHIASHLNFTDYEIYVNFTAHNATRIDGPFIKEAKSAVLGVVDFEYDTFGAPGEYLFYVRPCDCPECSFSVAPSVVIPENSIILTIGIVESGFKPRVLLVTTPANSAHLTVGTTLSKLLKEKHNIETMMDITDIKTLTISPTVWLKKSFDYATHVVFLVSDDKPPTSIYRNMDQSLYRLLELSPKKTCCIVEFPFTKPPKLELTFYRKFQLMRDYKDFINFLRKRKFIHCLKDKFYKNNLFNELIEQINNYSNNANIVSTSNLNIEHCESDENEINDVNSEIEESDNVPVIYREIANEFAINCDHSDAEEITAHPDVIAFLQSK